MMWFELKSHLNRIFVFLFFVLMFLVSGKLFSQVELVPVSHPVYDFLKNMQLEGIIPEYNSASIPISRGEVADYLKVINQNSSKLERIEKNLLSDYNIEFEYDMNRTLKSSLSFLGKNRNSNIFDDGRKYIFTYNDSLLSFFFDGGGELSFRGSKGDSIGNNTIGIGDLNFRLRGTILNTLGFYLHPTGGKRLGGNDKASKFASLTDPKLYASNHWSKGEGQTFDNFEGYIRYQNKSRLIAVTLGREAMTEGFGYIDKMLLSTNSVPFDFARLDLSYKALNYSFFYGALKGDSLNRDITYKNVAMQRLDVQFSNSFRMGFWDAIVISDNAFSLTYLNPLSFLFSADLNTSNDQTINNNSLFAIDCEVIPVKNLALQGTFLVDDMNFSTIWTKDSTTNDNKFGYQAGLLWSKAFTLPNLSLALEYTKLSPYTLSHHSNKSQFTNWQLPLGPFLPPNSDEISTKIIYNITNRLRLDVIYQHQRSAEGLEFDSTGKLIMNYGGYIYRGDGELLKYNFFLNGNRVNRDILTLNLKYEPIRQYYLEFKYQYNYQNLLYINKKTKDHIFFMTFRLDF